MQFDMFVCSVLAPSCIGGDSQHHREYVTLHRWHPEQPPTYVFTKCFPEYRRTFFGVIDLNPCY